MDFLNSTAAYFLSHLHNNEWARTRFVFPNTRAGILFSEALSLCLATDKQHPDRVIFNLRTTQFTDLVQEGNALRVPDALTLRCLLYDSWTRDPEADDMPFERFYSWAGIILADFDDIDKALCNAQQLLRNAEEYDQLADDLSHVSDAQRETIERFWHLRFDDERNPSGEQIKVHRRFFKNYERLGRLYNSFNSDLRARGLAYPGMLYREAATTKGYASFDGPDQLYAFIGLSLLSKAEQRIMRRLQKAQRATFLWDCPLELLENLDDPHAPGHAVAELLQLFPMPDDYTPPPSCQLRQTRIFQTTYQQSQTSLLTELLQEDGALKAPRRTAIVLPDRALLPHLLSRLDPQTAKRVNVTMGYSLKFAPVCSLVRLLCDLQNSATQRLAGGAQLFNHRVVRRLLSHPLVELMDGAEATHLAITRIVAANTYAVAPESVANTPYAASLMRSVPPEQFQEYATNALEALLERLAPLENQTLNRETVWEALKVTRRLKTVTDLIGAQLQDTYPLAQILAALVEQQEIDFKGMPLAGLQIMGILETRALDFDRIYVLDLTEGNWPSTPQSDSMIPALMRRAYGLTTSDQIALSLGYYFSRLQARCQQLTLLHPAIDNDGNAAQPSRYIAQLRLLGQKNVTSQAALAPLTLNRAKPLNIDKKQVRQLLYALPKLSPSALSDYIQCPLLFFLQDVVRLKPADDIAEEADARLTGNIFHKTMQGLYAAPGNAPLHLDHNCRQRLLSDNAHLEELLMVGFKNELHDQQLRTPADLAGRNILTFALLEKQARKTIETEPEGITIIGRELHIQHPIQLSNGHELLLHGYIDRLHSTPQGEIVVGDYKTGHAGDQNGNLKIESIADLFCQEKHNDIKAAFQTMTYCHILSRVEGYNKLTPYIIGMATLFRDPKGAKRYVYIGKDKEIKRLTYSGTWAKDFDAGLLELLEGIFDQSRPFTQTNNEDSCKRCDFRDICKR